MIFSISFLIAYVEDLKTNYDNARHCLWVCCGTVFVLLFIVLAKTPLFHEDDSHYPYILWGLLQFKSRAQRNMIACSVILAALFAAYFGVQVHYYHVATKNPTVTVGTSFIPEQELDSQHLHFFVTMNYDVVDVQRGNGPLQNQSSAEIVAALDSGIHMFPILTLSGEVHPETNAEGPEVRIPTFGILGTLDMHKWWNSTCDVVDGVSEFNVEEFLMCTQRYSINGNLSSSIDSSNRRSLFVGDGFDPYGYDSNSGPYEDYPESPYGDDADSDSFSNVFGADVCGRTCWEVVRGPNCLSTWDDQCPGEEPPSGFTSASTVFELCPDQCGPMEQEPSQCGDVCPDGYTNNFNEFGPEICENAEFRRCAICDGVDGLHVDSCSNILHIEAHESHHKVHTVKTMLNEGNSGKVRTLGMKFIFPTKSWSNAMSAHAKPSIFTSWLTKKDVISQIAQILRRLARDKSTKC